MIVALIDDGLSANIYNFFFFFKIKSYHIDKNNNFLELKRILSFKSTHADICFRIIDYYINQNYELIDIDISNDYSENCNLNNLILALKWCTSKKIDLINLSVGTIYYKDFYIIDKYLKILKEQGKVIVASYSNDMILTLPAASDNVIGVRCSINNCNSGGEYYLESDLFGKTAVVSSELNNLFPKLRKYYLNNFNSYATAYVSFLIFKIIENGSSGMEDVLKKFEELSCNFKLKKDFKVYNKKNNIPLVGFNVSDNIFYDFVEKTRDYFYCENYRVFFIGDKNINNFKYDYINYNDLLKYLQQDSNFNLNYIIEFAQVDILFIDMAVVKREHILIDLIVSNSDENAYHDNLIKFDEASFCKHYQNILKSVIEYFS